MRTLISAVLFVIAQSGMAQVTKTTVYVNGYKAETDHPEMEVTVSAGKKVNDKQVLRVYCVERGEYTSREHFIIDKEISKGKYLSAKGHVIEVTDDHVLIKSPDKSSIMYTGMGFNNQFVWEKD